MEIIFGISLIIMTIIVAIWHHTDEKYTSLKDEFISTIGLCGIVTLIYSYAIIGSPTIMVLLTGYAIGLTIKILFFR